MELHIDKITNIEQEDIAPFKPYTPYPGRLRKNQTKDASEDIRPLFDHLSLTVTFQQVVKSMPRFVKYLKQIYTQN